MQNLLQNPTCNLFTRSYISERWSTRFRNNLINRDRGDPGNDISYDKIGDDICVGSQAIKAPGLPRKWRAANCKQRSRGRRSLGEEQGGVLSPAFTSIVNSPAINVCLAIRFRTTRVACFSRTWHTYLRIRLRTNEGGLSLTSITAAWRMQICLWTFLEDECPPVWKIHPFCMLVKRGYSLTRLLLFWVGGVVKLFRK